MALVVGTSFSQLANTRDEARTKFEARDNPFTRGKINWWLADGFIDKNGDEFENVAFETNYTHNLIAYNISGTNAIVSGLSNRDFETEISLSINKNIQNEIDSRDYIFIPDRSTTGGEL